jgi:hypothetical protein
MDGGAVWPRIAVYRPSKALSGLRSNWRPRFSICARQGSALSPFSSGGGRSQAGPQKFRSGSLRSLLGKRLNLPNGSAHDNLICENAAVGGPHAGVAIAQALGWESRDAAGVSIQNAERVELRNQEG